MRTAVKIATILRPRSSVSSPAFSPADIDGLQWLLETKDATALYQDSSLTTAATTDEDVIGSVRDGSGNNRHATQATAGNKPILLTGALNGYPVIRFDGTDDFLTVPAAALGSAAGTLTLFFRILIHPDAVTGIIASGNKVGSNAGDWQLRIDAAHFAFFYNNATILTASNAAVRGQWITVVARITATGAEVRVDNEIVGSNTTPGVVGGNAQDIIIGRNTNAMEPLKCLLAASGVYTSDLTEDQLTQLHTYLETTYAAPTFTLLNRSDANVHAAQGVATDGTTYWTSAGTGMSTHLYKWSRSGDVYTLLDSRDVSTDWPEGATQINSLHYADGVIYAGCNNYATTPREGYILEYDADTLALLDTHATDAHWSEGGAFGPNGNFFVCHDSTSVIEEYDAAWTQVDTHDDDSAAPHQYSGIAWHGNLAFISWHEPTVRISVFKWTGSNLYLVGHVEPPTDKCTQGIHADPNDATRYWFAERSFATNDHRVVEARLANV